MKGQCGVKRIKGFVSRPLEDRFWKHVNKTDGCWIWTGAHDRGGYGWFKDHKSRRAHRVSWELFNGPIPEGLFVCHICDVRDCVNPDHLFLGTNSDNMRDMRRKGRGPDFSGEGSGTAKLTTSQVVELRRLRETGLTYRELSKIFGIGKSQAIRIVARDNWKRV
jgi:hypothetical protein